MNSVSKAPMVKNRKAPLPKTYNPGSTPSASRRHSAGSHRRSVPALSQSQFQHTSNWSASDIILSAPAMPAASRNELQQIGNRLNLWHQRFCRVDPNISPTNLLPRCERAEAQAEIELLFRKLLGGLSSPKKKNQRQCLKLLIKYMDLISLLPEADAKALKGEMKILNVCILEGRDTGKMVKSPKKKAVKSSKNLTLIVPPADEATPKKKKGWFSFMKKDSSWGSMDSFLSSKKSVPTDFSFSSISPQHAISKQRSLNDLLDALPTAIEKQEDPDLSGSASGPVQYQNNATLIHQKLSLLLQCLNSPKPLVRVAALRDLVQSLHEVKVLAPYPAGIILDRCHTWATNQTRQVDPGKDPELFALSGQFLEKIIVLKKQMVNKLEL